MLWTMNYQLWT